MKIPFTILLLLIWTITSAQPLEVLLQQVKDNNLALKALENDYLAALEKAPQVSQLPDAEVGIGGYPYPVETRLGAQNLRLSATQMFPWPGTLEGKADLETAKAKAIYERIAARNLMLSFELKTAWYKLYEIEQSQAIIQRSIIILQILENVALTKIESGKGTAADVIRVQLKKIELEEELKILTLEQIEPRTTINQLLNQPLDNPIVVADSLFFAELNYDKNELITQIEANNPSLRIFEWQQDVSKQAITLNALDGKPSFGVGVDYMMISPRDDISIPNNGRDVLQLRALVKIPLSKQKYRAKEQEEMLKIEALGNRKENLLSIMSVSIDNAFAEYETAQLRVALYEKQINLTKTAIQILQTKYSVQGSSFDELLQLEKDLIEYDLKILSAIVKSHLAVSRIERFLN